MSTSVNVHDISYIRATFHTKDETIPSNWVSILAFTEDHKQVMDFTFFMNSPDGVEALSAAINALAPPKTEVMF